MDSASPPPFQAIADVALARLMEARADALAEALFGDER